MLYKRNNIIKNWFLVLVWAGFIFFLSNQPDLKSSLPGQWDFILRKLAHISEYAILFFLLTRALFGHQISRKKVFVLSVALSIGYAISDEYHQSFIQGRHGSAQDVLIDSAGVFLSAWLNTRKIVK
ncbi:MAG: VanZ family protein [bacterium]